MLSKNSKTLSYIHSNFQCLKSFVQNGLDPHLFLQHYGFQALQSSLLEWIAIFLTIYLCPWVDVVFDPEKIITQFKLTYDSQGYGGQSF